MPTMPTRLQQTLLGTSLLVGSLAAQASLLGVSLDEPTAQYNSLAGQGIQFDAGTGAFLASGNPLSVQFPAILGTSPVSGVRGISIDLTIDASGMASSGSGSHDFMLWGDVTDGVTDYSGLLLTGSLLDFGYLDVTATIDVFDFLFDVTGGSLADLFGNDHIGVFMVAEASTFTGVFTEDFTTRRIRGSAGLVINPVPAPGTLWLAGLALSAIGVMRRKR
jgi:hypothetical protein